MTHEQLNVLRPYERICHTVDRQVYEVLNIVWPSALYSSVEVTVRAVNSFEPSRTISGRELLNADWSLVEGVPTKTRKPTDLLELRL